MRLFSPDLCRIVRNTMKKLLLALVAAGLVLVAGFGTGRAEIRELQDQIYYRLVFGMGVGSSSVSPDLVRDFLEKEVVPRFPEGMSVETAVLGQWMSPKGLIREKNIVVSIAAANTEASNAKIAEIGELYARRFANAKASLFVVPFPVPRTLLYY